LRYEAGKCTSNERIRTTLKRNRRFRTVVGGCTLRRDIDGKQISKLEIRRSPPNGARAQ